MDHSKYLIKFQNCKSCYKSKGVANKFCKRCVINTELSLVTYDNSTFNKLKKSQNKAKIKFMNPYTPKIQPDYYFKPIEKTIFINLSFTRFKDLEHLTSYMMYSNQVPVSQFVFHLAPELKKVPQIQAIITSNLENLSSSDDSLEDDLSFNQHMRDMELIYNPEFWKDLIRLYITNYQQEIPLFNLKYFDIYKISQPLLVAIYFCGYQYREDQPINLTEYMNSLFELNFKKIIYKPSLQNIQALFIYMNEYFTLGKTSLARACLAQITRMCYILGIHIDTNKFDPSSNFDRRVLIRQVASFDQLFSGPFRFYPNLVNELPAYDPTLYDPSWYLLPDYMLEFGDFDPSERILKSNLINARNYFLGETQKIAQFDYNSTNTRDNSEKLCLNRLNSLQSSYNEINSYLSHLKMQYPHNLDEIGEFEECLVLYYLHFSLITLEYFRLHQQKLNSKLTSKTISCCKQILEFIEKGTNRFQSFYYYLTSFTYMSIYQHLNKEEKTRIMPDLKLIYSRVSNEVVEFDSLNNLIFVEAFKKMEAE